MSITRKILISIILIAVIPALAAFYVFKNPAVFVFSTKNLVILIAAFIGILGITVFINLIRMLTKLCEGLKMIATGDINHRVEVEPSGNIEGLAISINQVSQKLRESADDLEKRTILIERFNQEIKKMNKLKVIYPEIVHELRAPLINIDKISSLLLEKLLEKKSGIAETDEETFLKNINANTKRLARLVDNLLDIYKLEAGGLSLKCGSFPVKDAIQEAVNSVDNWRQSKELSLEIKISDNIDNVYADRERIIQVIVNLLSNAIKFTPPKGKIILEAEVFLSGLDEKLLENSQPFIEISIQDSGVGISESDKKIIFERYKTASKAHFNTIPSTGLGLPIAKQIVEMHRGKIWIESQPGKGSKFTFIIPQGVAEKAKESKGFGRKENKKILIIDDEENLRELLDKTLSRKGYFVTVARDGLEGLKKALELYYDLVITDIRMPNVGGFDFIKILKRIIPEAEIMIITGFPIDERMERIIKEDSYFCLKKPFELKNLFEVVQSALPVSSSENN